jgi:nitronate monooxygenase
MSISAPCANNKGILMWPDRRLLDLLGIDIPIVQAPMAGAMDWELAAAVCEAGGLGSLPAGMLTPPQIREQMEKLRSRTTKPVNLNFFCHAPADLNNAREAAWRDRLAPYYREFGIDPTVPVPSSRRAPFNAELCDLVLALEPAVVSFHYGLPDAALVRRIKAMGAKILSSATTTAEARQLAAQGADAVIAQGNEAGGHRGMFLTDDLNSQVGSMALVPQIADAVDIPVVAAGAIGDARGIAAAFALGAAGVQIGTGYLFCAEAKIAPPYRAALAAANQHTTAMTNVFSGRPARAIVNRLMREVGPLSELAPQFPLAAGAVVPLRAKAESAGSGDFSPMLSGQAASLGRAMPAGELTRRLADDALARMRQLANA